jgi:hypothetical protein
MRSLLTTAALLLPRYPTTAQLDEVLAQDRATLPPRWGHALEDARSLHQEVRLHPAATRALVSSITGTLRHFPETGDIKHFVTTAVLPDWLEPEPKR